MALLSKIGLSDLAKRPPRERATFFFLLAMSAFLFMDQNLMAPNLSAIGEELVISRAELAQRLEAEHRGPSLRHGEEDRARRIAGELRGLGAALAQGRPDLLEAPKAWGHALEEAARARFSPEELQLLSLASESVFEREQRITRAFQSEVDDRLAGHASLWFWLLGGAMALLAGYLTDTAPRKKLLFGTILIGALPCLLTGFARTVDEFVALRALTGIGIGAVLPLTYSLLGDLFGPKERPAAAAWLGLASGFGIAAGQPLSGMLGSALGWRLPFILVAPPNLVLAMLFLVLAKEPSRGSAEEALKDAIANGAEYGHKIRFADLTALFATRTNVLVFLQGIVGSMPWGFFFTFLVDFYHSNKGYSVEAATLLVSLFGVGAILGGFAGGLLGGWLYKKRPAYLIALCAATVLAGIPPLLAIVNWADVPSSPLDRALEILAGVTPRGPSIALPAALGVVGAFLATMTSSNVKAVLINVNPPENRGTIFSLFTLADDLGKGLAPFLIGSVLAVHLGRVLSYNVAILMWVPCGLFWVALIRVFPREVDALERSLADQARCLQAERSGAAAPQLSPSPSLERSQGRRQAGGA